MSLLYYQFLGATTLSQTTRNAACAALVAGILLQSGGFFVHMLVGQPNRASIGTAITTAGACVLAVAVAVLVYGLITIA